MSQVDQVLEILQSARQEIAQRGLASKLTPLQKALLDRVVETPLNPVALRDAAFVFLHALGMPDVARVFFEKAIALDPGSNELSNWLRMAEDACRGMASAGEDSATKSLARAHYGQRAVVREKPRVSDIIRQTNRVFERMESEEDGEAAAENSMFAASLDMASMTVDQLIAASTSALYEKKVVRAWVHCRRAAELDLQCPALGPLVQELCKQFLEHNDRMLAVQAFSLARDMHPRRAESWLNLGHALHRAERLDQALEAYAKAGKIEPENMLLQNRLATLYFEMDRFDEAEEASRRALHLDGASGPAWNQLAATLTAQNRLDEAVGACSQGLQQNPDYHELWFKLGVLLFNQGVYADAREAFVKGEQFTSGADYTSSYLCLIDIREGLAEEAMERMQKIAKLQKNPPLFWLAWNELALSFLEKENYAKGVWAGQHAVRFGPENYEAWYNLGIACHFLGRAPEAISSYEQAVGLQPDCVQAWHNLAVLYSEKGEYERARDCLQEVVRRDPDNATAYYDLSVAWERSGDEEMAAEAHDRAVQLSMDDDTIAEAEEATPSQDLVRKGFGFIKRFKKGLFF